MIDYSSYVNWISPKTSLSHWVPWEQNSPAWWQNPLALGSLSDTTLFAYCSNDKHPFWRNECVVSWDESLVSRELIFKQWYYQFYCITLYVNELQIYLSVAKIQKLQVLELVPTECMVHIVRYNVQFVRINCLPTFVCTCNILLLLLHVFIIFFPCLRWSIWRFLIISHHSKDHFVHVWITVRNN